jgi:ABC-type arginine transport system permease subunit
LALGTAKKSNSQTVSRNWKKFTFFLIASSVYIGQDTVSDGCLKMSSMIQKYF